MSQMRTFSACKSKVFNRGSPPDSFLNEILDWAQNAPEEIFAWNDNLDIYTVTAGELGEWSQIDYRKAQMLEVLRVLGGFESSWNWKEGIDTTNSTSSLKKCNEEAGIFQCSGNSMYFDESLRKLLKGAKGSGGKTDCDTFIALTKVNHQFATEYCARLLRFTVNHHGPIKRKEINIWLRREAMAEFMSFL